MNFRSGKISMKNTHATRSSQCEGDKSDKTPPMFLIFDDISTTTGSSLGVGEFLLGQFAKLKLSFGGGSGLGEFLFKFEVHSAFDGLAVENSVALTRHSVPSVGVFRVQHTVCSWY